MDENRAAIFVMPTALNAAFRLNGTGTTEDVDDVARGGSYISILVGAVAIRVTINDNATATTQVATTDLRLPAETLWHHSCSNRERYVHCEAADGASAYEAWVWNSSP